MSTIYRDDYSLLEAEGWEIGSRWSALGTEGFYVRHTEHTGHWIEDLPLAMQRRLAMGCREGDFRFTGRDMPKRNRSVVG